MGETARGGSPGARIPRRRLELPLRVGRVASAMQMKGGSRDWAKMRQANELGIDSPELPESILSLFRKLALLSEPQE